MVILQISTAFYEHDELILENHHGYKANKHHSYISAFI